MLMGVVRGGWIVVLTHGFGKRMEVLPGLRGARVSSTATLDIEVSVKTCLQISSLSSLGRESKWHFFHCMVLESIFGTKDQLEASKWLMRGGSAIARFLMSSLEVHQ